MMQQLHGNNIRQPMKKEGEYIDDSSGYTDDISSEMDGAAPAPIDSRFGNIRECYVSASGHTRLLTATRYGKIYMLKCLKPDYLYTPVYRQALAKEFEIGLLLDHPNICRTIGMEDIEGLGLTIVMDYIDGDTLQQTIKGGTLTADLARKAARQLASALDYMHSKQIVHRDLKPANIMLTHHGQNIKLIDFGLADSDSFNVLKLPAGTSGYIAPELLIPGATADERADTYSLGMVMRDMAEATGDKQLMHLAALCTRHNAADRPAPLSSLFDARPASPWQRVMVGVLICVASALAAFIATELARRSHTAPADATAAPPDSADDGNRAIDYSQWPR